MNDECPHGFSDPAFCADCRKAAEPPAPEVESEEPRPRGAIKARYEGRCVDCHDPIELDDYILPGPGAVGWIHAECAS